MSNTTETPVAPPEVQRPPVQGVQQTEQPRRPPMYIVILVNDDTSHPGFVTDLLVEVFGLDSRQASAIMLRAHRTGSAPVRTYSKEVAETKVALADNIIKARGVNAYNPQAPCELRFTIEPESGGDNG